MPRPVSPRPVLVVEDNIRDVELLRDALEGALDVARIVHVRDGALALEWLEQREQRGESLPCLMLLDLKMPRMTGMELLARVREHERFRFIPVVMMTSSHQEGDLAGAYALGVNAYIRKPLEFEAFVATMSCTMRFWMELNELPRREGH